MIGLHHDIDADAYHADPAPEPSLSSSIANVMLDQSPRHAFIRHPRLAMQAPEDNRSRDMELGSAVHAALLGKGRPVHVIDADAYQTKVAKEAREYAYANGMTPLLRDDHERLAAIVSAFHDQIEQVQGCDGFASAAPEVVAIAQDTTGAWLRCMMDKLDLEPARATIWDVKTTGQSAAPQAIGRKIADMGYDVQAAFYERVLVTLQPELAGRITFRWAFIETAPPYLLTVAELDNTGLAIGRKKAAAAIGLWNRCMQSGVWPGYPAQIITAEYPAYAQSRWLAREMADELLAENGIDPFLALAPWQPPRAAKPQLDIIAP